MSTMSVKALAEVVEELQRADAIIADLYALLRDNTDTTKLNWPELRCAQRTAVFWTAVHARNQENAKAGARAH